MSPQAAIMSGPTMRVPSLLLVTLFVFAAACGEADDVRRSSSDVAPGPSARGKSDGCVVDAGSGVVRYRVERGDTLAEISERFYGDAALWRAIAAANPGVVTQGDVVRAGDELVIPFEGR